MCDVHIPEYAYKEQHINCYACGNIASTFMVDSFIPSNYRQAMTLSSMKINQVESELIVDAKGNKQSVSKIVGSHTPWFAENTSKVPLLVPICGSCKEKIDYSIQIVNQLFQFLNQIQEFNYEIENVQYIHCHYGFSIFKMQKERFNSGSPYLPWISEKISRILEDNAG